MTMEWRQLCLAMALLGGVMARDDLLCMPNEWSGRYFKNALTVDQGAESLLGSISEGWATFDADKGYMGATETGDRMYDADNPNNYSLSIYQKGTDSYVSIATPIGSTPTCYYTNLTDRVPEARCLTKVSDKWTEANFNLPNGGMYNGKYAQFAAINNDTHRAKNESVQIGFLEQGTNFPLTAVLAEYNDILGSFIAELQMATFSNYEAKFNKTLFKLPSECNPLTVVSGPEGDRVAGRETRRVQKAVFVKGKTQGQAPGATTSRAAEQGAQKPHKKKAQEGGKAKRERKPAEKQTVICHPPESTYELFAPTFFGAMMGNLSLSYEAAGADRFGFQGTIIFNERAVDVRLIQYNGGPHGRIWFEYKDIFNPPNLPPFSFPFYPYQPAAPTPRESKGGYHCNANGDGRYFAGLQRCRNATGPRKIEVNGRPAEVFKLISSYTDGGGIISLPSLSESYVFRGNDGLMLGFMNLTNIANDVVWSGAATLFNPRPVADEAVLLPPEHCENNYLPVPHDPFPPSLPTPFLRKEQEQEDYDYARAPRLVNEGEGAGAGGSNTDVANNDGSLKDEEIRQIMDAILGMASSL